MRVHENATKHTLHMPPARWRGESVITVPTSSNYKNACVHIMRCNTHAPTMYDLTCSGLASSTVSSTSTATSRTAQDEPNTITITIYWTAHYKLITTASTHAYQLYEPGFAFVALSAFFLACTSSRISSFCCLNVPVSESIASSAASCSSITNDCDDIYTY